MKEETLIHHEEHDFSKVTFGFWIYIMSDCLLFASLFATYAVLHTSTFGGPTARELFSLPFVLIETLILLTSSFTAGLAMWAMHQEDRGKTLLFWAITFILGISFVTLELREFSTLIAEGNSYARSAFLSSFFTLVGTHGLHVSIGALWMLVLMVELFRRGFTTAIVRGLTCLSLFWHFLDIVWIFIFTIVYLFGAL